MLRRLGGLRPRFESFGLVVVFVCAVYIGTFVVGLIVCF